MKQFLIVLFTIMILPGLGWAKKEKEKKILEGQICDVEYIAGASVLKTSHLPVYTLAVPECSARSTDLYTFINDAEAFGVALEKGERTVLRVGQKIRFYTKGRRFWPTYRDAVGELKMVEPDQKLHKNLGRFDLVSIKPGRALLTQDRMERIIRGPESVLGGKTAWLGATVAKITREKVKELRLPEERGALVIKVWADSPAAKAGLKANDVITEFNDQLVEGYLHLSRLVRETPVGRTVRLTLWRDGRAQAVSVELASFPAEMEKRIAVSRPRGHGVVRVKSEPDSAEVFLGIELSFVGNTPSELRLPAGEHIIWVKLKGYQDWTRTIMVLPGSQLNVKVKLEARAPKQVD